MHAKSQTSRSGSAASGPKRFIVLDEAAIEAPRRGLDGGAITPNYGLWRDNIIKLLNDALATELVCVLRYKRHHFTAIGMASPAIATEFMAHAIEESGHADRLAERIVQLGGDPDFSPESLSRRSHAAYDGIRDLKAMIESNLVAVREAVESYCEIIELIGDKDSTTRLLVEDILSDEQGHADELRDWFAE